MSQLKRTPIYEQHKKLGAKFVPFAGWEMPIQYTGIIEEHTAVRSQMGLFDVSHMGEIEIGGKRALDFCQRVSTNDVSSLKPGKIQYTAICNEQGGIIDDCTLYRLSEDQFLFVVNASRKDEVMKWFEAHALPEAKITDRSDDFGLIALQGKASPQFLSEVIRRDLETVLYYEFIWTELCGSAALISRTGYTGEDGFEIYLPTAKTEEAWALLIEEGKKKNLVPAGLGCRDTLRLEMGYLLYGNDMNDTVSPLEAGLSWIVNLEKGFFHGREAIVAQHEKGVSRKIRGIRMKERGIPRSHYEVRQEGKKIGEITSGTFSPTLREGIGLGLLDSKVKIGDSISVVIREKEIAAEAVKPPFVKGSIKK